jgi:hypothetical protein
MLMDWWNIPVRSWRRYWEEHWGAAVKTNVMMMNRPHPPPEYWEQLLALGDDLRAREQHGLVVIVAQMACEVRADQIFDALIAARGLTYLQNWIEVTTNENSNLGNQKVRDLYVALSGDTIQTQSFWSDYQTHARLRNDVVHGVVRVVSATQAEASLTVARQLINHLGEVQRRITP